MPEPVTAILLAGSIRRSPLAEAMRGPVLELPLGGGRTLGASWLERIARAGIDRLVVTANEAVPIDRLRPVLEAAATAIGVSAPSIEIRREVASHRGAGGVVRDIMNAAEERGRGVLVIESARVPPADLGPLLEGVAGAAHGGAVGVDDDGAATGVMHLSAEAVAHIPEVGYFDLKEQLLPRLHEAGLPLRAVVVGGGGPRVRTLRTAIAAMRATGASGLRAEASARFAGGRPGVQGFAYVGARAWIGAGVALRDAIVLDGAEIGDGVVLSNAIVGRDARVAAGRRVLEEVIGDGGVAAAPIETAAPGRRVRDRRTGERRLAGRRPLVPGHDPARREDAA